MSETVFIMVTNPLEDDIVYVKELLMNSDYSDLEHKLKNNMKLFKNIED